MSRRRPDGSSRANDGEAAREGGDSDHIGGVPSQLSASSVSSSTISEEYVRVVLLGLAKVATFCVSLADAVV